MVIIPPGGQIIAPRKKFHEVVGTATNPLVKTLAPRRVKIIAGTAIRGTVVHVGSVFEFDVSTIDGREDFSLLLASLKAEKVDISAPLFTAPAPVAPPPLPIPERNVGTMELARALVTALKEASPRTGKA